MPDLAGTAESLVQRLRAAEQQCRNRYTNPHSEAATVPVVRELAELVLALTVKREPAVDELAARQILRAYIDDEQLVRKAYRELFGDNHY